MQDHQGGAEGAPAAGAALDLDRLIAAERELADVEHALGRLDAGTWGSCETCGAALAPEVLARHPGARRCPAHPMA